MSEVIIFDTSVLVDEVRTGRHRTRIESVDGLVRVSSVVLAELLRGVSGPAELKFLRALLRTLAKNHPVLTPTRENWLESGEVLAKIRADRGFAPAKLRDLHFDVLIALTARSHGARLITTNRTDFELISQYRPIKLEVW
jgi:predicted nucleic acid-binding protein